LGKVEKENSELEAIDVLDNYKKTVDEYNKTIVEYKSAVRQRLIGASIEQIQQHDDRLQQLKSKIADLDSRIDMYDEWIRTKGIYTEAIANQMFDTSKLSTEEYMNVVNRGTYGSSGLAGTVKRLRDDWKEITNGENYKASGLLSPTAWLTGTGKAIVYAGDVITAIGEGAMGFLYNYTPHTADSRKVDFILSKDEQKDVASPETQKYIDYLVNKMYKGRNLSGRKLTSKERENVIHLDGDFTDPDKIKEWKDEHRERIKELTEELNMDRNAIHQGRFKMFVGPMSFVPDFMNPTIKWYNPEDISEAYNAGYDKYNSDKQATEENKGWLSGLIESTVKHPLYAIVGTGSTISLFKNQLYAMGVSQGFATLLSFIVTKNPALAMSAKFAQAAKYAQNAVSVGAGIAGAYNSRIEETGMEKLQAIQEKLYDDLIKRGVNYGQLRSNIKTKLTNDFKLDVSDYNDQELLEAAISYNLTDIVPGLKDSQKGIEKLVNANNALAVKDYLETLPFMKFEGSFLKNTLSRGREAAGKVAQLGRKGVSKIPQSDKLLSVYDKTKSAVGAYKNKVFDKFISHDADFIRSANGRMLAYAGRKAKGAAKILAYEGVLEGGEEGVQTILSKNFRNGLYDDSTNKQESMFDLNELLNLPGLYSRAYLDYFGLNDDDPYNADPELRKAMNIGYASSIMFSGLIGATHSASTNIRNNPYDDNLRQLRQQIKSDRIVDDIISSYAKRAQDHDHIGIYFDRFKENNKSIVSLIRSLNDMKDNLPADS